MLGGRQRTRVFFLLVEPGKVVQRANILGIRLQYELILLDRLLVLLCHDVARRQENAGIHIARLVLEPLHEPRLGFLAIAGSAQGLVHLDRNDAVVVDGQCLLVDL